MGEKETIAQTDSPITQIITDAIEDGWSEHQVLVIISKNLLEKEENVITRSQL